MRPAGYSGTPLARKLGIGDGHKVVSFGAPARFASLLDLPGGATLSSRPRPPGVVDESETRGCDVIVLFALTRAGLEEDLRSVLPLLNWSGGLWIGWPKKSSSIETELSREVVREVGLASGLVDNKVCAIDDDWSGLRFVYRREDRPG